MEIIYIKKGKTALHWANWLANLLQDGTHIRYVENTIIFGLLFFWIYINGKAKQVEIEKETKIVHICFAEKPIHHLIWNSSIFYHAFLAEN